MPRSTLRTWCTLQGSTPDTFVFATGNAESVRDFATMAFDSAGIEIGWHGKGAEERATTIDNRQQVVRVSAAYHRPAEVEFLIGDFSKAERELGWRPRMNLRQLCTLMVEADIKRHLALRPNNGPAGIGKADRGASHAPALAITNGDTLSNLPHFGRDAGAIFSP